MSIGELQQKIIEIKRKMDDAHRDYRKAYTAGNHSLMRSIKANHAYWLLLLSTANAMLKLKMKPSSMTTMPEEKQAITAEMDRRGLVRQDCPECFGTGHRFGFGAPCSKGCEVTA